MTPSDDQILLLVDENDQFSGEYARRKECHTEKGKHHRAFIVLLEDNKGKVLLQKRKHNLWYGYWDITATSHVLHSGNHDETYQKAADRALQLEMGIPHIALKNIGGFNYYASHKENCENEYCAVLTGTYNGLVKPNKSSVYQYKWIDKEEFIANCQ